MVQEIKIPKTRAEALEVLNLANNVNDEEIKRAYKKCALKWHPDKWSGKSEEEKKKAEENFKAVNVAHKILTGEITEEFISNQTNDNWADKFANPFGSHLSKEESDLFYALFAGDLKKTKILLGEVKNVNVQSKMCGETLHSAPLHYIVENACKNPNQGWEELLEEILSKHSVNSPTIAHTSNAIGCSKSNTIDINIQGNYTGTPLYIACKLGSISVVNILLNHGANTNVVHINPGYKVTPLYRALKDNRDDIAELLFRHGAKIDASNDQQIAIMNSIPDYNQKTVMILLPHASDKQKNRMLQSICLSNKIESDRDIEVAGLLLREGADPQYSQYTEGEDITNCSASGWVIIKKKNRLQELFTQHNNGTNNNLHQKQQDNQPHVDNTKHNSPQEQFLGISPRGWAMIATGAIVGGVIGAILAATGVIPAIAAIGIIATAVLAGIVGAFAGAIVGGGIGYLTTDIVINRCCSGANVQAAA